MNVCGFAEEMEKLFEESFFVYCGSQFWSLFPQNQKKKVREELEDSIRLSAFELETFPCWLFF